VDPVKRKVISELFLAPSVVLPIVGGISSGLLSWAMSGNAYLTGAAVAGVLGGVGWMLTRMIFNVEDITAKALAAEQKKLRDEENRRLDELAAKLRTDRDHRTQDYLTLLRSLQHEFEEASKKPGIQFRSARMREQISSVLGATVDQLNQSYRLWELSENLIGDAREKILNNREQVLEEVEETIDRLRTTAHQIKAVIESDNQVDLATMREELEATMRIAKRTEERMREIENPTASFDADLQQDRD
jgi:paraquat-inducible protein B